MYDDSVRQIQTQLNNSALAGICLGQWFSMLIRIASLKTNHLQTCDHMARPKVQHFVFYNLSLIGQHAEWSTEKPPHCSGFNALRKILIHSGLQLSWEHSRNTCASEMVCNNDGSTTSSSTGISTDHQFLHDHAVVSQESSLNTKQNVPGTRAGSQDEQH